jgi:hypothetical protein
MSTVIVAAVLAAGAAGVASADDGSMGRFGDSYAYFNSQPVDKAPLAWRAENPNGISERQLQAYSGSNVSSAWETTKPVFDRAPSDFRLAYPNGLAERELQALSSEGPAWHTQAAPRAVASSGQTDVVQAAK